MKVSLIVAVYKDIEALDLIVSALKLQTYKNFELIVAEDNNSDEMRKYVSSISEIDVIHTYQEDRGVRKSRSVNNAILKATGEYLIFIDGDCIPYATFVESHVYLAEKSTVLSGRRLNLGELFSLKLREKKIESTYLEKNILSNFFELKKDIKEGHLEAGIYINPRNILYRLLFKKRKNSSLLGCNYSCFKEDMLKINGLDESYGASPVADDTDMEWRFRKAGLSIKSCKFAANIFHLYHTRKSNNKEFILGSELTVMHSRMKKDNYKALVGLDSHL
ncbi:MAG: glycosyltransferase [Sulfurimonas sp.]|jgi:glycosyltransferase involved in cell wall biosynthesis